MQIVPALFVGVALALAASAEAQDHHAPLDRGASVMGFDQHQTVHHFSLFADGGAIEVGVKDPSDARNLDAIRSHLPHIAQLFSDGNFAAPMLVHDSADVPGTKALASHKANIRYRFVETPTGGRVDIVTTHPEALAAVHEFLKFQITDHKTGDPLVVRKR